MLWAQISFPQDNFVKGWEITGQKRSFSKGTLFNYINGGAEIFLEFGFEQLHIQSYTNGKDRLTLNIYQMENADAALGIYLNRCGKETPLKEIQARNSFDTYQLTMLKGAYFIQIDNFSGNIENKPAINKMANFLTRQIKNTEKAQTLRLLPREDRIAGSEMILRGPYALQSVYTFGKGDILQLSGKIFAATADYKNQQTGIFSRLIVAYPDPDFAQKVYQNLIENLDSYLSIIDRQDGLFSFIDYKKKYGQVRINKNIMEILFNLSQKPAGH